MKRVVRKTKSTQVAMLQPIVLVALTMTFFLVLGGCRGGGSSASAKPGGMTAEEKRGFDILDKARLDKAITRSDIEFLYDRFENGSELEVMTDSISLQLLMDRGTASFTKTQAIYQRLMARKAYKTRILLYDQFREFYDLPRSEVRASEADRAKKFEYWNTKSEQYHSIDLKASPPDLSLLKSLCSSDDILDRMMAGRVFMALDLEKGDNFNEAEPCLTGLLKNSKGGEHDYWTEIKSLVEARHKAKVE